MAPAGLDKSWWGVELRHLAALAAVAEEGSFRGAASRLGYVQSAVSQQISRLEQLIGLRLLTRTRGQAGVELTEAGALLLAHSERILSRLAAAQADLRALGDGRETTEIRVGTTQSVATRVLPAVVAGLHGSAPDLQVTATESGNDADHFEAVERGDLDIAFAELPLLPGPFAFTELLSDPSVLIVQSGSPLAARGTPPALAEIAALPLIRHPTWRTMRLVEDRLRAGGLTPNYRFRSETNAAVQALVAAGVGAAIMPRLAVDEDDPRTAVIDLGAQLPARALALYWHRDRRHGPALSAFRDAVRGRCEELARRSADGEPPA